MQDYKIEACTAQHIGNRAEQQDRVALLKAPRYAGCMLALVADGMGGKSGGALASEQAIMCAKAWLDGFSASQDPVKFLKEMVADAHHLIKLTAITSTAEPHTTLVALLMLPTGHAYWLHAGDSRIYQFRRERFVKRSTDHSLVQRMVAQQLLRPEQISSHRLSHVITNVLGDRRHNPEVEVTHHHPLRAGDNFLLCTDGLWHYFSEAELGLAIHHLAPRPASEALINKARELAQGRGDNCSMVIIRCVGNKDSHQT